VEDHEVAYDRVEGAILDGERVGVGLAELEPGMQPVGAGDHRAGDVHADDKGAVRGRFARDSPPSSDLTGGSTSLWSNSTARRISATIRPRHSPSSTSVPPSGTHSLGIELIDRMSCCAGSRCCSSRRVPASHSPAPRSTLVSMMSWNARCSPVALSSTLDLAPRLPVGGG
jgi:hypothetical protein